LAIWRLRAIGHLFQIFKIARKRRFVCLRKRRTRRGDFMKAKKKALRQEVIDKYDGIIRKSFSDFGISFDNYPELRLKFIMIRFRNFLENCMNKGIL
jgi:hypothetical protein